MKIQEAQCMKSATQEVPYSWAPSPGCRRLASRTFSMRASVPWYLMMISHTLGGELQEASKSIHLDQLKREGVHAVIQTVSDGSWGGFSHVKAYGNVLPKWVTLSLKIHRQGSNFGYKILRRGSFFTKIAKKIEKSAIFEVGNSLEMGPNLRIFWKNSPFLREKHP